MKATKFQHENSLIRMPWGRYRDHYLTQIPDAYLKWAVINFSDAGMAHMMATELIRRHPELELSASAQKGRKTT